MSRVANEASSLPSRASQMFRGPQPKTGAQDPGAFAALMDSRSEPAPAPKPSQKADKPAPRDDGNDQTVAPASQTSQPDNAEAASAPEAAPAEGKPERSEQASSEVIRPLEAPEPAADTNIDPTAAVITGIVADPNAVAVPAVVIPAVVIAAAAGQASPEASTDGAEKPAAVDAAAPETAAPALATADEAAQPTKKAGGKQTVPVQAPAQAADGSAKDTVADEAAPAPTNGEQAQTPQGPLKQAKPEAAPQHAAGAQQGASVDKPETRPATDADSAAAAAKVASEPPAQLTSPAPVAVHAAAAPAVHSQTAPVVLSQPVPVNAIAVEIAGQARAGNSRFEIRLDPPELGRIDVRLDVDRDGNVTSRLVIDRSDTYDLLRRDQSTLERALQQAGLKTSDNALEFQLRDQGSQNPGFAHQQRQDDAPARSATALIADADVSLSEAANGYARLLNARGGIDIRV